MSKDKLRDRLQELHHELESASQLSMAERDVIGNLMTEIVVLANAEEESLNNSFAAIGNQLEKHANQVEANYPRISAVLRQIMDSLAKMGI